MAQEVQAPMQAQLTEPVRREALHEQIATLAHANWRVRTILHAMVDMGVLIRLECQLPECFLASREFAVQTPNRGHNRRGLVLDHIVPQSQGGSDRLENLRPIHGDCNVMRSAGWTHTMETRALLSKAAIARESWRPAVEKRQPGWNRATRPDDQRRHRTLIFTEAQVREIRQQYAAGGCTMRSLAEELGVTHPTIKCVIHGLGGYGAID